MPDLADILEFVDATGDILAARVPAEGPAVLRWGSQLIVREGQSALFLRDGRSMQVFEPGRHVLTTQTVAGLTGFVAGLAYDGETPFRAEVVFVGRQLFRDLRWGTPEPVYLPDPGLLPEATASRQDMAWYPWHQLMEEVGREDLRQHRDPLGRERVPGPLEDLHDAREVGAQDLLVGRGRAQEAGGLVCGQAVR